jgi:hypothetical protein
MFLSNFFKWLSKNATSFVTCFVFGISKLPFQKNFFFNQWSIAGNEVFCLLCFFLYKQLAGYLMDLQEDCEMAKLAIKSIK